MIKKRIYPVSTIQLETLEMLMEAIQKKFPDGVPDKRFDITTKLTASEVRSGYAQGMLPASLVEEYDLFKKRNTIITYKMHGPHIESVVVEDEY